MINRIAVMAIITVTQPYSATEMAVTIGTYRMMATMVPTATVVANIDYWTFKIIIPAMIMPAYRIVP